jgi:hypothetical protein
MEILLYNPDNQVTINGMRQIWMLLLKPDRPPLQVASHGQPNLWLTPGLFCAARSEDKSVSEGAGWNSRKFPGHNRAAHF